MVCPFRFGLLSWLLFLCPFCLWAADYYVSPQGADANDGSAAGPWASLNKAVQQLQAGDTLYLAGGVYAQRLQLKGLRGTKQARIVIRNVEGETPILDGAHLTVPPGGIQAMVSVWDCDYLSVEGLTIRNFKTSDEDCIPAGIAVMGSGTGVAIRGCTVHDIWQSGTEGEGNAFGICVYGTAQRPIDGFVLDSCEVYNLRTGLSESVVLNGNVTRFTVSNNLVHDCNNIGIDFIGYEGSAPKGVDRAREGVCVGNTVYNIDSAYNPAYGGDFTRGGGDQSAAGIYVDGGSNIVIERNLCHHNNYGIELASEHRDGVTDHILVRNNLLHHNMLAGLIMGGYDAKRGRTQDCTIRHNVLYRNDTALAFGGQVAIQFYFANNAFEENIVWANPETGQLIIHYVEGGSSVDRRFPDGNFFDYNVYYTTGEAIEFGLNQAGKNCEYETMAAWQSALGGDTHSVFANPSFQTSDPGEHASAEDFRLALDSVCRDLDGRTVGIDWSAFTAAPGSTLVASPVSATNRGLQLRP